MQFIRGLFSLNRR